MKLHLPKNLHVALMSAIALLAPMAITVGSAAWGNSGLHENRNFLLGGKGAGGTSQDLYTTIDELEIEGKLTTTVDSINATSLSSFNIWADSNANAWTAAIVGELQVQNGASVDISESQWKGTGDVVRYFDSLNIQHLNAGDNGNVGVNVSLAGHTVVIDKVTGTVSSLSNAGTLTIGTAESTTVFSGTIENTGTLTINGAITVTDTANFQVADPGQSTWSDAENSQGFLTVSGATLVLSTGNTTIANATQVNDGGHMRAITVTDGVATFVSGTSVSTIYKVINADVIAGSAGTEGATGYDVASGRTLFVNAIPQDWNSLNVNFQQGSYLGFTNVSYDISSHFTKAQNIHIGDGGIVSLTADGWGNAHFRKDVLISAGGKLVLKASDTMGWGDCIDTLTLKGTAEKEAIVSYGAKETLKTNLDLQGNARFQNTGNGALELFGGTITASGTNNTIEGNLMARGANNTGNSTITVKDNGELTITGNLTCNYDQYKTAGDITKLGGGKLTIGGTANTANIDLILSEGSLEFSHGLTLTVKETDTTSQSGTLTTADNTTLILGGSITNDGSGAVSLGGNVVINNSTTDGVYALKEGTVSWSSADGENGYRTVTDGKYYLVKGGTTDISGIGTVTFGETNTTTTLESVDDGVVFNVAQIASEYYYVNTAVTYGGEDGVSDVPGFMLNGGTLTVADTLDSSVGITGAAGKESIINLTADGVVANSAITKESGAAITATGSGTIQMAEGVTYAGASQLNTALSADWTGTVEFKNAVASGLDFTQYGNANSTIKANGLSGWYKRYFNLTSILELEGDGMIIADSSIGDHTISNKIIGTGALEFSSSMDSAHTFTMIISADTSEWSGTMKFAEHATDTNQCHYDVRLTGGGQIFAEGGAIVSTRGASTTEKPLGNVNIKIGNADTTSYLNATVENNNGGTMNVTVTGDTVFNKSMTGVSNLNVNEGVSATIKAESSVNAVTVSGGEATLELNSKLTVTGDMSVAEGGILKFGNGSTLSVNGSLTLDASAVQLGFDITSATDVVLATATGGMNVANVGSWTGAQEYIFGDKTYTSGLSVTNDTLSLTFKEMVTSDEPITTTVTGDPLFANGMLTLDVTTEEGIILSSGDMVLVNILTSEIMEKILGQVGDAEYFGVTLRQGETKIVGGDNYNVGFLSENGCYYGELVGGTWQYNVGQIPEPTTATLSLLALMGLAARRRRK